MKSRLLKLSLIILAGVQTLCVMADSPYKADAVTAPPEMAMPEVWSFNDCVEWASANTTDIRKSMLDVLMADQDLRSARDAWLPSVGFSTNQSLVNFPSPEGGNKSNSYASNYGITANWTVWEGNVRKYRTEASKMLLQQQELAVEEIRKTITLNVLQAYLNILYAREAVDIAASTLEVSTAEAERACKLMDSGRISKVDYMQIESQKAQDAYSLVQARTNCGDAVLTLKKLLQLGFGYNLNIADVNFEDDRNNAPLPPAAEVYQAAVAWLPAFKSNSLSKEIYAQDVKVAKAGYLPVIGLSGAVGTNYTSGGRGWSYQMGHGFNENLSLNLTIPIFDGNTTKRAVAKAKLAELEYDLTDKSLLDTLTETIEGLYFDAENARAKYQSGLVQLEAASLTNELTMRQFELGLVNPLELLTAHNKYLNARLELLQSKYMAMLASKTIEYYATQHVSLP